MDLSKIASKYTYSNGMFCKKKGPHAGQAIDQNEILSMLLKEGYKFNELQTVLNEMAALCKEEKEEEDNKKESIKHLLSTNDYIQNFRIVKLDDEIFTYYLNGNRAYFIQQGYPESKSWVEILFKYMNKEMVSLKNRLAPLLYPKAPWAMSIEDATRLVTNGLDFSHRDDLIMELEEPISPVSLQTSDELSLYKVPYEHIIEPKLNPTMAEFLSRVSDADYLCAITWLMFNGHKSPYVVYLYGTGGEGKSSFLNVLARKVGTRVAYQNSNQFSNFHMYGKAMITLTENTDCFMLQSQSVKQITGNSIVACEEKGKGSFSSTLSGTLYVDANKMLKLKGEEAEFRRLRLFKVKKANYTVQLDMKTYEKQLSENFIDFLNHCRICFEKLGTPGSWLVPASEAQKADFQTLTDKGFVNNSEFILHKVFADQNLEYDNTASISSDTFWKAFFKLPESKERYLADNVRDYLFLHKQVSEVGDKIFGIKQNTNKTTFNLPVK